MWDRQGCSIIHSPLPFICSATSFSVSSPLPRHIDYAPSLFSQWRGRNHTPSFEHKMKCGKTTTRTTDHCMCLRVFVCLCSHEGTLLAKEYFPRTRGYTRIHDVFLDVSECICRVLAFMLSFCLYLCASV